jgi:hypothetical protein
LNFLKGSNIIIHNNYGIIDPPQTSNAQHKAATAGKKSIQGIGAAIMHAATMYTSKAGII